MSSSLNSSTSHISSSGMSIFENYRQKDSILNSDAKDTNSKKKCLDTISEKSYSSRSPSIRKVNNQLTTNFTMNSIGEENSNSR